VTDKQLTVSSVGMSSMQLESIRQTCLPTRRISIIGDRRCTDKHARIGLAIIWPTELTNAQTEY